MFSGINESTRYIEFSVTMMRSFPEKMSSLKTNDDGDYLENFTPLSYPNQDQDQNQDQDREVKVEH